jgi:hypothetical protein
MVETVVVLVILSLSLMIAQAALLPLFTVHTFKGQAQTFISTLQRAANAAARSDNRYEVIIDLIEQKYTLRHIQTVDLENVLDEEIIETRNFGKNCRADYVIFDDLAQTDEEHQIAKFRAGRAGWQYGGKIVLFDSGGKPYSVIISRIGRIIELKDGDVEIALPQYDSEMSF